MRHTYRTHHSCHVVLVRACSRQQILTSHQALLLLCAFLSIYVSCDFTRFAAVPFNRTKSCIDRPSMPSMEWNITRVCTSTPSWEVGDRGGRGSLHQSLFCYLFTSPAACGSLREVQPRSSSRTVSLDWIRHVSA